MAERSGTAATCACAPTRFFGEPLLPDGAIARQSLWSASPTVIEATTREGLRVCWLGRRALVWTPAEPLDGSASPQPLAPKRRLAARLKAALEVLKHG